MKLSFAIYGGGLLLLTGTASAFQVYSPFGVPSSRSSSTVASAPSTPLAAFIDINESAERDLGTFDEWASNCGVIRADGFQPTTEDGSDWSVVTTAPLAEGSPVLQVPSQVILNSNRAKAELGEICDIQTLVGELSKVGAATEIPQFCLFLKVLVEYEKGEESPWFPWLNSLPRLFFNAASMTNGCYDCLPPLVLREARGEMVKFDNFYNVLQKVDFLSAEIKAEKDIVKWAFNIVYTRSFGDDDEKQIVPMADMFNHGTETEVDFSYDEEGNCNVFATRDVPADSPLRMSYGCPTNPSRLFAVYGFLDESSPATFCKLMNIQPNQELYDIGFDFARMLFYKDTGEVSEEVWDVLLYDILKSNVDIRQSFYEAHMNGDAGTKEAIHNEYFFQTRSALKNHVDTFLITLEDLSEKARSKDIDQHPRAPLILHHNEFVATTFMRVKANLDPIVESMA